MSPSRRINIDVCEEGFKNLVICLENTTHEANGLKTEVSFYGEIFSSHTRLLAHFKHFYNEKHFLIS